MAEPAVDPSEYGEYNAASDYGEDDAALDDREDGGASDHGEDDAALEYGEHDAALDDGEDDAASGASPGSQEVHFGKSVSLFYCSLRILPSFRYND